MERTITAKVSKKSRVDPDGGDSGGKEKLNKSKIP